MLALAVAGIGIAVPGPWLDEAATVLAVRRDWPALLTMAQGQDAPLLAYYLLAKLWLIPLAGLPALVALRWLSAVASAVTVLLLQLLAGRRAGPLVGSLAALFLIALPGFSRYAQEARPYALMTCLVTAGWLAWDRRFRPEPRPAALAAHLFSLAAALAIQLFSALQWPAQVVADLTAPHGTDVSRRRRAGWSVAVMLLCVLVAAIPTWAAVTHGTGAGRFGPIGVATVSHALGVIAVSSPVSPLPLVALLLPAAAGAALLVVGRDRQRADLARIALCWAGAPTVLLVAMVVARPPFLQARYFLPTLPPLAVLAALGTLALAQRAAARVSPPLRRAMLVWLALVPVLGLTMSTFPAQRAMRTEGGHGRSQAAALDWLDGQRDRDPHLLVLISPPRPASMIFASRPELARQDVLYQPLGADPRPWPQPRPDAEVTAALADQGRVLWLREAPPGSARPSGPPAAVTDAGFTLGECRRLGSWWVAVLHR